MTRLTMSRRRLLGALGAGAASMPFLPSMLRAQPAAATTRFVVFFSPNEPISKAYWEPSGSGADRALPAALPTLLTPLNPFREKLLLLGDMKMVTRDHDTFGGGHVGIGHMLTGHVNIPFGSEDGDFWAGGISVDQFIANRLGVDALTLGVSTRGNNGHCRMSYRAASEPVTPVEEPTDAFEQIFGDTLGAGDPALEARRSRRASVLDAVARNITRTSARLGAAQRARLDRHLTSIRSLEERLNTTASGVGCAPTMPAGGDYPTKARQQIDLLVEALTCGVSRVATLQLGNSGGSENYSGGMSWPSEGIDFDKSQHVIAHDFNDGATADEVDRRERIESVYYRLFAYLLERLDSVEEEGGTLLDNTVVLYAKNIGADHRGRPMFYMLAGRAGGALRTGRYISRPDVPHNDLLVSLCHLMGQSDVDSFGDPAFCTGAVTL